MLLLPNNGRKQWTSAKLHETEISLQMPGSPNQQPSHPTPANMAAVW